MEVSDCVCLDGASLLAGKVRGFVAKVLEVNPGTRFDHCLNDREAIVAKTSSCVLKNIAACRPVAM